MLLVLTPSACSAFTACARVMPASFSSMKSMFQA